MAKLDGPKASLQIPQKIPGVPVEFAHLFDASAMDVLQEMRDLHRAQRDRDAGIERRYAQTIWDIFTRAKEEHDPAQGGTGRMDIRAA